jgi:hypothetical protein
MTQDEAFPQAITVRSTPQRLELSFGVWTFYKTKAGPPDFHSTIERQRGLRFLSVSDDWPTNNWHFPWPKRPTNDARAFKAEIAFRRLRHYLLAGHPAADACRPDAGQPREDAGRAGLPGYLGVRPNEMFSPAK